MDLQVVIWHVITQTDDSNLSRLSSSLFPLLLLCQIRFQGYSLLDPNPYPHSFAAFSALYSAGGIRSLYRGATPTIARAAILTGSQLASYDHSKRTMLRSGFFKDTPTTHFMSHSTQHSTQHTPQRARAHATKRLCLSRLTLSRLLLCSFFLFFCQCLCDQRSRNDDCL